MPIITPDFTEAMDLDSPIPAEIYKVRITKVEQKKAASGNDYLNWTSTIVGAEGDLSKFNGRSFFFITMISGAGASSLKTLCKSILGETPAAFDTDSFIGKEVLVHTKPAYDQDGKVKAMPQVKYFAEVK